VLGVLVVLVAVCDEEVIELDVCDEEEVEVDEDLVVDLRVEVVELFGVGVGVGLALMVVVFGLSGSPDPKVHSP